MRPTKDKHYVFKRHASIGAADAEDDGKFFESCFVDTGDLDVLRDCQNPKRIIVGRTGIGKSALIRRLQEHEEHVIQLPPETLSLNYITNSDVLNFFEGAGVKLDIFYQLLWRHVFAVELIRCKYGIRDEKSKRNFLERLKDVFDRDNGKAKGVAYLEQWGEKFWQETEYRIKEFTTRLEQDLKAQLGAGAGPFSFEAGAVKNLTEEQKQEVVNRGQKVVNNVQMKDLSEVMRLLAEDVFTDPQERFYITIDRLDEDWAEARIRYKLIRALIETIRSFQKLPTVKVVISLRTDLLERVYELTRDSGFQEEKYESLYLPIKWTRVQLKTLLDLRVQALVREQYTTEQVHLSDILPKKIAQGKQAAKSSIDYILDRTFMRPRDAILFLNSCLEKAEGKAVLSAKDVKTAEGEYSVKRLRSLQDEWGTQYPNVIEYSKLLENREFPFKIRSIGKDAVDALVLEICAAKSYEQDPVYLEAQKYIDGKKSEGAFKNYLFRLLYKLGLVGIKTDAHTAIRWSYTSEASLHEGEVKPNSSVYIHPTFWRVLGINPEPLKVAIEQIV